MIGIAVDQVTTQGVAIPLVDTRGLVPAHIRDRDHTRGHRHQSPVNLASHPGTSEGKVNEKPWTLNLNVTVTST